MSIDELAARIASATAESVPIPQLSSQIDLSLDDAYRIQAAGIAARVAAGERVIGAKLGFTSREKARQMGVDDVILGTLTDRMAVPDGGVFRRAELIHPRIEPEIAFRFRTAQSARVLSEGDADATDIDVAVALEVIDSRFADFRFDLADVVADNTSAARFVLGAWMPLAALGGASALGLRAVRMEIDGTVVAAGSTDAILGDPWRAVRSVGEKLAALGGDLDAGAVLLAGAATEAVPLPPAGVVTAAIAGIGRVSVEVTP